MPQVHASLTVRQYARALKMELLRLKGIHPTDSRAGSIRVSDREARYEMEQGYTPSEAAALWHRGYGTGGVAQHACHLANIALRYF